MLFIISGAAALAAWIILTTHPYAAVALAFASGALFATWLIGLAWSEAAGGR